MVVAERFDEIARDKFHVIEFCEIKNMRFRKHGRGDIQIVANIHQIIEKVRIGKLFAVFVYVLFTDSPVCDQLCPNSHTGIIHEK